MVGNIADDWYGDRGSYLKNSQAGVVNGEGEFSNLQHQQ